jgi:hypothetical protein
MPTPTVRTEDDAFILFRRLFVEETKLDPLDNEQIFLEWFHEKMPLVLAYKLLDTEDKVKELTATSTLLHDSIHASAYMRATQAGLVPPPPPPPPAPTPKKPKPGRFHRNHPPSKPQKPIIPTSST